MLLNEISGHNSLALTSVFLKRVGTLLKLCILLSLLVLSKYSKEKRQATIAATQQTAISPMPEEPSKISSANTQVFLPFSDPQSVSLAQ